MSFLRLAVIPVMGLLLFSSCQSSSSSEKNSPPPPPAATQLTGKQLSQSYCGSCHQAPDPLLLDKETWQRGVLPQMALRMGQSGNSMAEYMRISNMEEMTRLMEAHVFPETPMLHPTDWQKIVDYYTATAPAKLPSQAQHTTTQVGLPLFQPQQSTQAIDAFVTLLRYDSLSHRIWAGDGRTNLYALDAGLHRVDSAHLSSPATDIRFNRDGSMDLLLVGVLNPNDRQAGEWSHFSKSGTTPDAPTNQTTTTCSGNTGRPESGWAGRRDCLSVWQPLRQTNLARAVANGLPGACSRQPARSPECDCAGY